MEFLNPEQVLSQIELSSNMTAADFGCGSGGWAIPLAQKLKTGKVYAIDVQEEALSVLRTKMEMAKINNIKLIKADLEQGLGSSIQNNLLDLVLATNLLFQATHKQEIINEAKRILRQGGRLLVVDWKADVPLGPKEGRIAPSEVKDIAENSGFVFDKEVLAGKYHYGLVFRKP